jgi:putative endopeptidase
MKRLMIVLFAGTALAGCATTASKVAPPPEVVEAPPPAPAAPAPKAEIGTFGFDTGGMDKTVRAGDNFYQFANGTWAKSTPIPADKSNYGMFTKLDDLSKERTREIIEESARAPDSKIGTAYASFMDEAAVEAKGLAPLQPWLDEIKALKSKSDYPALIAKADRMSISHPFPSFVGLDDKVNTQYAFTLFQGGIGMPDRDYYIVDDERMRGIRAKYLQHLTNVLTLAGEANAAARAKAIMDFETKVAKVHWTQIESRDATKTYNKMTLADLQRRAPGFDFAALLDGVGVRTTELIIAQPSAIAGTARLIRQTPLSVLKDQMLVRSIDG